MVKSPPDLPSDKPKKLNFFRLVDQLTSERHNAATWIIFLPCSMSLASGRCAGPSQK